MIWLHTILQLNFQFELVISEIRTGRIDKIAIIFTEIMAKYVCFTTREEKKNLKIHT
jgi:hypothetical protein